MSKTETSLDHLSARALSDVLSAVAAERARPSAMLGAALAGDKALTKVLERHLPSAEVARLQESLSAERPRVTDLADWKDKLKIAWSNCEAPNDRGSLMIFYHAVIARAYASTGRWLTSREQAQSMILYEDLARVLHGSSLGSHFVDAVDRAQKEAETVRSK